MDVGKTAQQLGILCFAREPQFSSQYPCEGAHMSWHCILASSASLCNSHTCIYIDRKTYIHMNKNKNRPQKTAHLLPHPFFLYLTSFYWRLAFTPGPCAIQFYSTSLENCLPKLLLCSWEKNSSSVRIFLLGR